MATTWQYIEHILGIFWLYLGHILIISWPHLEDILSISSYSYSHIDLLIISIRTEDFLFQQNKLYVLFQLLYISSSLNLQTSLFFPSSLDNFIQNWGMDFESQMCFQLHLKNLCQSNSTNLTPKFFWPNKKSSRNGLKWRKKWSNHFYLYDQETSGFQEISSNWV